MKPFQFTKELLQAVDQLEIVSRRRRTALLSGNTTSKFRGAGMQFKEFRQYEPGDDIRHVSWTATARSRKTTLKLYEEERELNVVLLMDVSGSSLFGKTDFRKVDMYMQVMALLGLSAIKAGNRFGCLFFNTEPLEYLPPQRSRQQLLGALSQVQSLELEGKKSDIVPALKYLRERLKSPSLIFIMSDFLLPPFANELGALSKKHEIVLLQGYDDAERLLASEGVWEITDPETGEFFLLDSGSKEARKLIQEYYLGLESTLETLCRKNAVEHLLLSVEDDYLQRIVHFFKHRPRMAA